MNLYADQGVGNKLKVGGGSTSETSTIFQFLRNLTKKDYSHTQEQHIYQKLKAFINLQVNFP